MSVARPALDPERHKIAEILKALARHRSQLRKRYLGEPLRREEQRVTLSEMLVAYRRGFVQKAPALAVQFIEQCGFTVTESDRKVINEAIRRDVNSRKRKKDKTSIKSKNFAEPLKVAYERFFEYADRIELEDALFNHPLIWLCGAMEEYLIVDEGVELQDIAERLITPFGLKPNKRTNSPDLRSWLPKFRILDLDGSTDSLWKQLLEKYPAICEEAGLIRETRKSNGGEKGTSQDADLPKRRGRKKADYATVKREAKLAAEWARSRDSGVYKADFSKGQGMTRKSFDRLLDRVAARKRRSDN